MEKFEFKDLKTEAKSDSITLEWEVETNIPADKLSYEAVLVGEEDLYLVSEEPLVMTNSYTFTGLAPNSEYALFIRAFVEPDHEFLIEYPADGKIVATKDGEAPRASSLRLHVSNVSDDGFVVAWTKAYDNITPDGKIRYKVYLGVDGEWIPKEEAVNITSFKFTGLAPCKEYKIRVEASDEAENVLQYADVSASTSDKTKPVAASTLLKVTDLATDGFTISWESASDNITPSEKMHYRVMVREVGLESDWKAFEGIGITSYTFKGLKQGTEYSFFVRAFDEAGNYCDYFQPESKAVYVTKTLVVDEVAPIVATKVITVSNRTDSGFTINWTPASDDVTPMEKIRYRIWLKVHGEGNWRCVHEEPGITSYTFKGLKEGTVYSFYVEAFDEKKNKLTYLNPKTGQSFNTVTADHTAPEVKSSGYSVSGLSGDGFTLAWAAAKDNITISKNIRYRVFIKEHGQAWGNPTPVQELTGITTYTFTGLKGGTEYDFYVEALDAAGNSTKYPEASKSIPDAEPPRAGSKMVTVSDITPHGFTISWEPASDSVTPNEKIRYKVWLTPSDNVKWNTVHEEAGISSYTFTGLKEATAYSFFVEAYDEANQKFKYFDTATNKAFGATTLDTPPVVSDKTLRFEVRGTNVTVLWNIAKDAVTSEKDIIYSVFRTESGIWQKPILLKGVNYYTFTGLKSATQYSFRVEAKDKGGNVIEYPECLVETEDTEVPDIHGGALIAVKAKTTADSITIQWDKATDKVTADSDMIYKVGRTEAGAWAPLIEVKGSTSHKFTGLKPATTYKFRAFAFDKAGNSSAYPVTSETTLDSAAPVVSDNSIKATPAANSVTLEWKLAGDDVTDSREIRYVVSQLISGNWKSVQEVVGKSSVTISGLTSAVQYSFKVDAFDKAGNCLKYNTVSVITKDNVPPTISRFTIDTSSITENSVSLEWTPASDNKTEDSKLAYRVLQNVSGDWRLLKTLYGQNKYTVTGLEPGKQYTFKVAVHDTAGNEKSYNSVSVNTADKTKPTINNKALGISNITHDSFSLTWAAASDNVSKHSEIRYKIYLREVGTTGWTAVKDARGYTSHQVTGLKPYTQYSVFVRAIDGDGNYSDYSTSSVTTLLRTVLSKPAQFYCNGVYSFPEDHDKNASFFYENIGSQLNRSYFELSFDFYSLYSPKESNDKPLGLALLMFGRSGRWMGLCFKDGYIYVSTANHDHQFNTYIRFERSTWQSIRVLYDNGRLNINGKILAIGNLGSSGDHVLSSCDYSRGACFKGYLKNLVVKCK